MSYYYHDDKGRRIDCPELPAGAYGLMGFTGFEDKNMLCMRLPNDGGLTPLYNADGTRAVIDGSAGKTFNGKNWIYTK